MPGFLNIVFSALSSLVTDAYFNFVTLLLNTNDTNGAQNNTFLDSSSNNFTITRNGNVTQGTFTPFSQTGWSVYFDGTNDYIDTPASGVFAPAGDFTIGAYFYLTGLTLSRTVISNWTGNNATDWEIMVTAAGTMQIYTNGSTIRISSSAGAIATNTWYYVALCRSGTTITAYLNGTSIGTYTQSGTFGSSAKKIEIGSEPTGTQTFLGYISNVWLVDGQAITTVPTAPITTTFGGATASNVKLLTCQSNRFVDNSNNAFALTPSGDVSIQPFSPFVPAAAYDSAVVGGSGYFDGSGDYLSISASANQNLGTSDFTYEFFWYPTSIGSRQALFCAATDYWFGIDYQSDGKGLGLWASSTGSSWDLINADAGGNGITSTNPITNSWNHIAVSRTGGTWSMWLNGTRIKNLTGITASIVNRSTDPKRIGTWAAAYGSPVNGYIFCPRLVIGSYVYAPSSSTITVPTATLTAITNTQLLLSCTNAGVYDSAAANALETVGNAQVSTAQSKWGNSSLYCGGTSDWFVLPSNNNVTALGTGDFTVEFWVRFSSFYNYITILSSTRGANGFNCGTQAAAQLVWYANGGERVRGTTALSTNTWYHIAFVRYNGTLKGYINGVQDGTTYADTTNYSTPIIRVGNLDGGGEAFTGYLDDIRITKGYARYTANFTPPTAAFPVQ